jgi:hypothetical protein
MKESTAAINIACMLAGVAPRHHNERRLVHFATGPAGNGRWKFHLTYAKGNPNALEDEIQVLIAFLVDEPGIVIRDRLYNALKTTIKKQCQ